MQLVGNSLNGKFLRDIVQPGDRTQLEQIDLAVAYVKDMDLIFDIAASKKVPLNLYAQIDGDGFPALQVVEKFINSKALGWRLFLTRNFYHPKIIWMRGLGAYIGSANLTQSAWLQNIECGIWLTTGELDKQGWNERLSAMFGVIRERCREARSEDLTTLRDIAKRRRQLLSEPQERFNLFVKEKLSDIPGVTSPIDGTKRREPGGLSRKRFLREWDSGLTILRKLANLFEGRRNDWPSWVQKDVPPAIVQDQATEWWWHTEFRRQKSRLKMPESHTANAVNPDVAVERLLEAWCQFECVPNASWLSHMNESPRELRELLSKAGLADLTPASLQRILFLCHSARDHGRQIGKSVLGLPDSRRRSTIETSQNFAEYLWKQGTTKNRWHVRDVLLFVIWGDGVGSESIASPEERLWTATEPSGWGLPHLKRHILGELLGYARPHEYPPRNNRVSKTLFALGFDVDYE